MGESSVWSTVGCVVLESTPRWEPVLRAEFASQAVAISAVRSGRAALESVQQRSRGVLIAAVDENPCELLRLAATVSTWKCEWQMCAILSRMHSEWEWPLRELGVGSVLDSQYAATQVARYCRRWLEPIPNLNESILAEAWQEYGLDRS